MLTFGKSKCRVDGADNVSVGHALVTDNADGVAHIAEIDAELVADLQDLAATFAMALYPSTVNLDIIVAHVYSGMGTTT